MGTGLLAVMIFLTVSAIIAVNRELHKTERPPYICKDIPCKYGVEYCCYSCGQRKECEVVCDYNGSCDWRVKYEE